MNLKPAERFGVINLTGEEPLPFGGSSREISWGDGGLGHLRSLIVKCTVVV